MLLPLIAWSKNTFIVLKKIHHKNMLNSIRSNLIIFLSANFTMNITPTPYDSNTAAGEQKETMK